MVIPRPNRKIKDQTGRRFGRLVIAELVQRDPARNHIWRCICDCGNHKDAKQRNLVNGATTSCGCAHRDMLIRRNTKHGLTRQHPREYRCWKDMRSRCNNANDSDYKDYGGRGIAVCARWDDFAAFLADMGARPDRHSIDRIDVQLGYAPENCRWADDKQQANNKRSNVVLAMLGRTQTLMQWCDEYGIDRTKVRYRLSMGWPLSEALRKDVDGRSSGAKRLQGAISTVAL
jgi:hypothetical protein